MTATDASTTDATQGGARLLGARIRLHPTLAVPFAILAGPDLLDGEIAAAAEGLAIGAMLFCIVLLHELGHVATGRAFGIATPRITLMALGGIAGMESIGRTWRQRLAIALGGPAVNVVLLVLAFVPFLTGHPPEGIAGTMLAHFMILNLVLLVFNMMPVYPMDGGRVLQALLSPVLGDTRAMVGAAAIGVLTAGGLAVLMYYISDYIGLVIVLLAGAVGVGEAIRRVREKRTGEVDPDKIV